MPFCRKKELKIQPQTEEIYKFIQALDMTLKQVMAQETRFVVLPGERSLRSAAPLAGRAAPIALTHEQIGAMFIENAKVIGLKVRTESSSTQRSSRIFSGSEEYQKFKDKLDVIARNCETKESFLKELEEIKKEIFNSSKLSHFEKTDLLNVGEMMKQMAVWMEKAKEAYFDRVMWGNQVQSALITRKKSWWHRWGRCAAGILGGAISAGLGGCGVGSAVGLGFASIPGCGVGAIIGAVGGGILGASSACY